MVDLVKYIDAVEPDVQWVGFINKPTDLWTLFAADRVRNLLECLAETKDEMPDLV